MSLAGNSYEEIGTGFRWQIPARFNIAQAVCDRHVDANRTALIFETGAGETVQLSFEHLQDASQRLANAQPASISCPNMPPRVLNAPGVAAYLGRSLSCFNEHRAELARNNFPPHLVTIGGWDREAIGRSITEQILPKAIAASPRGKNPWDEGAHG